MMKKRDIRDLIQSHILKLANKRALQQTKNISLAQSLQDTSFFDNALFGGALKSATKKRIIFEGDYDKVYEGYKVFSDDGTLIDEGKKCKEGKELNEKTGRCQKKKVEKKKLKKKNNQRKK
jgi:alanine-alpha-ketoisovalerate/valine-pyruvate aminotransferase